MSFKMNHESASDSGAAQHTVVISSLVTALAILVITRLVSAGNSSRARGGAQTQPDVHPYWIPFIGHALWMTVNPGAFLLSLRRRYPEGVFSLWCLGAVQHVVYKPSLVFALLDQPSNVSDESHANGGISAAFGVRKEDRMCWLRAQESEKTKHLGSKSNVDQIMEATTKTLKRNIADFITSNSYPADQMDWERVADTQVIEDSKDGTSLVVASLMELTKTFVAKTASPSFLGTDFVENFPDMWELLWTFDTGFSLLTSNVPSWVPLHRRQQAKVARSKMLQYLDEYHDALNKHFDGQDPGAKWQDLDNVSDFCKSRVQEFRKDGVPLEARASLELAFIWAMAVESSSLVPWMLFEIYRDPVLLEQIREEVSPFVEIVQPKNDFGPGIWIPAEITKLDVDGLVSQCPRLNAAYIETLRLYTDTQLTRWLHEDVFLQDAGSGEPPFLLKKNTLVHVPLELQQRDPERFPEPEEWRAERHLKDEVDENGQRIHVASPGNLRPYGTGPSMCKGKEIALREIILFTAVIISYYDIGPVDGRSWDVPNLTRRGTTKQPSSRIRVSIRKREETAERI